MVRSPSVRNTDTTKANTRRTQLADEHALDLYNLVENDLQYDLIAHNIKVTRYQIVKILNEKGYLTRMDKPWTINAVKRAYNRIEERGLADE